MFKTETHLHVSEVSPCGKLKAAEMVKRYYDAGYKTIFVTDHIKQKYTDSFGDISWQDKMAIFMSGYYRAKCVGDELGINVLPSAEFAFDEELSNHYLVYGITREFLEAYPEICKLGIEKFSKIAHEHGLFIVQAHPYRDGKSYPTPEYVDAFEVYNSNPRHEFFPELSLKLEQETGLPSTGGSDAHRDEDVAGSGIITEFEIKTAQDYINALKDRTAKIIEGKSE